MRGDDVPAEYQLSFWIGEVVRNDVYVETETRVLWSELNLAGLCDEPIQRDYGRVISQVRRALRREEVPAPFRDLALQVVGLAANAHRERNQLAHDQWVSIPWVPGTVSGSRAKRRDVGEFAECARRLLELTWRMRGVGIIAPAWLEQDDGRESDRDEVWHWTRVAMGGRSDEPGVVRGSAGPATLPPNL